MIGFDISKEITVAENADNHLKVSRLKLSKPLSYLLSEKRKRGLYYDIILNKKACKSNDYKLSREDRIRTCDPLVPNQVRYRPALLPALSTEALAKVDCHLGNTHLR